jgi:hypothetical protein
MSQFPNQKLTRKEIKKEFGSLEEWARHIYDSVEGIVSVTNTNTYLDSWDKEVLYDLSNGILNIDDFTYVIKPFGDASPKHPAELRHYDRISPKLHLLQGEEIKRPFNFRVVNTNPNAVTAAEKYKQQMIYQSIQDEVQMKVNELLGAETDEEVKPQTIEEINLYMDVEYKDAVEIQGNMALEYLKEYEDILEKFNDGWRWLLVTGDDIYYTSTSNNEPLMRVVDPRYFEYDRSPHVKYIDEAQWAYEERWIPATAVYTEFGELLSEDDMEAVEKMKGSFSQNVGYGSGIPVVYLNEADSVGRGTNSYIETNSNSIVRVVNLCWVGLRKLAFVTFQDEETGEILERVGDEDYVKQPEDIEIEWKWVNEVWEAVKLGDDLIVGVRPRPNQYKSLDNPNKVRLPYTGISDYNLSVVKRVKEMQYLYNIMMYRMELATARAKGKLLVMDTAQIPQSEGIDMEKWIYYTDTAGFAFINSFEEGKGMFQGQRPQFNQFTQIDLTLSNTIQQYIFIMDKLDHLIEDITGVTPQRQGQVSQYETQGGIERSIVQSSAITEYLFYIHNRVKRRVLTNLIEECKLCWMEGKKTQYIMDDMTRRIIDIDGEIFPNAEVGIFVNDSQKSNKIKQFIESNAQAAIQAGQVGFDEIIGVLETDSLAAAKNIFTKGRDKAQQEAMQQQQQQQESQAQMQQQQLEAQRQMAIEEREDKQAHEKELKQMDIDAKVAVAEINSFKFQQDQDVNDNNIPDQLEIEKLRLDERKDMRKHSLENRKLNQKDREIDIKSMDLKEKRRQANKKPVKN